MDTKEEFEQYISSIQNKEGYKAPLAYGVGIRKRRSSKTLEVFFPMINYNTNMSTCAMLQSVLAYDAHENGLATMNQSHLREALKTFKPFINDGIEHKNIDLLQLMNVEGFSDECYHTTDLIVYFLYDKDQAVKTVEEGYFKIQCLSQLHVKPHDINVNGIFGVLNNVAWSNKGPILPEDLSIERIKWSLKGEELVVSHVDKFPYMVNFHVPEGVRIVSGAQVRLGAHLSSGTTVMPAGFVNFNAGTLGHAMIEGRVSAGVVVGKDSDVGGGASIMGTLSGGNKNVISIGEKCLLGANAGTGISLGDGCTIAAGVYVTAAAKISLYDENNIPIDINGQVVEEGSNIVKGSDLSGRSYLLYFMDSLSGRLIAKPNTKIIELNKSLHV